MHTKEKHMILTFLRSKKHPKVIDLGLIAVEPEYLNHGVPAVVSAEILRMPKEDGIEYADTNLNLETNASIQNMWKRFTEVKYKRYRAYVKRLVK